MYWLLREEKSEKLSLKSGKVKWTYVVLGVSKNVSSVYILNIIANEL